MKNGAATQCRCDNGRNVESFLTFGFPDGSTEVSQCSDNSIVHHQNHWGVFVCTRYAYCRLRYVSGQLFRRKNNSVCLFHRYQFLGFGLRRWEASKDSFSSSKLCGAGFFREDSSHLSSSSR